MTCFLLFCVLVANDKVNARHDFLKCHYYILRFKCSFYVNYRCLGIYFLLRHGSEMIFFHNLLYYVTDSKKSLPNLVHRFHNIPSKLETKCKNRLRELQFFQKKNILYREGWNKKQKILKSTYLQTILKGFFCTLTISVYSACLNT